MNRKDSFKTLHRMGPKLVDKNLVPDSRLRQQEKFGVCAASSDGTAIWMR